MIFRHRVMTSRRRTRTPTGASDLANCIPMVILEGPISTTTTKSSTEERVEQAIAIWADDDSNSYQESSGIRKHGKHCHRNPDHEPHFVGRSTDGDWLHQLVVARTAAAESKSVVAEAEEHQRSVVPRATTVRRRRRRRSATTAVQRHRARRRSTTAQRHHRWRLR